MDKSKPPPSGGSAGRQPSFKSVSSHLNYKPLPLNAQNEPEAFIRWFGRHWRLWTQAQRAEFCKRAERGPRHVIAFARRQYLWVQQRGNGF